MNDTTTTTIGYTFKRPKDAMKHTTIFYYQDSSALAKELCTVERDAQRNAFSRDATTFDGETEECDAVVVLADVKPHFASRVERSYGAKVRAVGDLEASVASKALTAATSPIPGVRPFDGAWPTGDVLEEAPPAPATSEETVPKPAGPTPPATERLPQDETARNALSSLNYQRLKQLASKHGVDPMGRKTDLVNGLLDAGVEGDE